MLKWLLTILLAVVFLYFQAVEYHEAYTELGLTLNSGIYGATFFMLTGFHGFHVMLGTTMLFVMLLRCFDGAFSPEKHFAFEAVGLSVTIQQAFDSLAKTGKTIVIGIPSNDTHISISAVPLVFEERTITGSLYGSAAPKLDIPNMIKLYEDGKLNLDSLLTDRYPLEEINEAYDAMIKGKSLRSVIVF